MWSVPPRFKPKRSGDERRRVITPRPTGERRQLQDRRGIVPPPEWVHGWLCFEAPQEKRRLAPVPERWEECSAEELEQLRRQAVATKPDRR